MSKFNTAIDSFFGIDFLRKKPGKAVLWCYLLAAAMIVPSLQLQELLPKMENLVEEELNQMANTPIGILTIILFAPIFEELVFRASILRFLLFLCRKIKGNPWIAIILAAILFAAAHMNPAQIIHPLLMGTLLGWIYYRTKSVLPGILIHSVNNTLALLTYWICPDEDATLVDLFGSQTIVIIVLIISLSLLIYSIMKLNKIMKF